MDLSGISERRPLSCSPDFNPISIGMPLKVVDMLFGIDIRELNPKIDSCLTNEISE
jgi:hypothetical protein